VGGWKSVTEHVLASRELSPVHAYIADHGEGCEQQYNNRRNDSRAFHRNLGYPDG